MFKDAQAHPKGLSSDNAEATSKVSVSIQKDSVASYINLGMSGAP